MPNKSISNTTNIFCIMGKPGAGKEILLKNVLNRNDFIEKYSINRLVYGTTRPMNAYDIDGETYHFMTREEFMNIDQEDILESRSYDTIFDGEYYYFTLKSYIKLGTNYIGKVSTYQYDELKKWAFRTQLQFPTYKINIYPIMVNAPIFEREKRMISKASTDEDIYKMCTKFISERYEFNTVIKDNPEMIDRMNPNTLIIDNSKTDKRNISVLGNEIEMFIAKKLIMQGI